MRAPAQGQPLYDPIVIDTPGGEGHKVIAIRGAVIIDEVVVGSEVPATVEGAEAAKVGPKVKWSKRMATLSIGHR